MNITWRLRELMNQRGIKATTDLQRRVGERCGEVPGLSQAQVYRLVEGPELLNLRTLDALCRTLDTTPAELLTEDVAGVPDPLLNLLLAHTAAAAAHYNLCSGQRAGTSLMTHPGDPFGKVLAWLWRTGRQRRAVEFVADYLAEMRAHNPHSPKHGERLTWSDLRFGIAQAIRTPYDLSDEHVEELCAHLERELPSWYGAPLAELNTP